MDRLFSTCFLMWLSLTGCDETPASTDADADADGDVDGDADADSDGDVELDGDFEADRDADAPSEALIETAYGPVLGARREGYLEFLGIPYAAPPVDDLRFRPPQPPVAWDEPWLATSEGAACPQEVIGIASGDEDCLFVNVHTPDPLPESAPVMVWIHGGGFGLGKGTQTDGGTRGDLLAAHHGVVVVSMNYRLGALGFLAHPALTAESGSSGNWGFLDQVAALRWVRDTISSFGGDPENVTIFGESAGGASVCLHMLSPHSAGLFDRAITQSGLCDTELASLQAAELNGQGLAALVSCDGVPEPAACLREVTPAGFIAAAAEGGQSYGGMSMTRSLWPNVDGDAIPGSFRDLVTAGEINAVPTIVGWNANEGTLFVMLMEMGGAAVDEAAYVEFMQGFADTYGVAFDDLVDQYPSDAYPDPGAAVAAALGEGSLACPSRRAARLLASQVETRVYHFEYPDAAFQLPGGRELGAYHSAEIQYIFGHPAAIGVTSFRDDDLALNEAMAALWTSFARDGDPAVDGLATWPVYDVDEDVHLTLDRTIATGVGADRETCLFWEGS